MQATQRTPVLGVSGGVGSGKSYVAQRLATLGHGAVIDADQLAAEALSEPATIAAIRQRWGDRVLNPDGSVNRKALAEVAFGDPAEREALEGIIHPRVHARRQSLRQRYDRDPRIRLIVEDCPLLMETGLDAACDETLFVAADRDVRLKRLAARGWEEAELDRREKNQMPLDTKAARADHVLRNDAGEPATTATLQHLLSRILPDETMEERSETESDYIDKRESHEP